MNGWTDRVGRVAITFGVGFVAAIVALIAFVVYPADLADLLGVLVVVVAVVGAIRLGSRLASSALPTYNVAEVAVTGPITRDGGGRVPTAPLGTAADEVVDQIEQASESGAKALILRLNTPGGQVVPSEDIRLAAAAFEGPTIAYATDTCASGGYWIATGCDEVWAREGSIVGSIGVIGSVVSAAELADRLGLQYERLAAGEYKDAGMVLKELAPDEREYLQGVVDDFYEQFVDRVAEGRNLDPDAIRETEARVFLGTEAADRGLVDELGTRDDIEDRLADRLDGPVSVREFESSRGLAERLRGGASHVAYALGAGIAGAVGGEDPIDLRL